jgi:hypothetical protein
MRPTPILKPPFKHPILNSVLSERPTVPLYHYTDQAGLLGIVKSKKIWATHHQYLNDTQEYLHAKGLVRRELHERLGAGNSDSLPLLKAMQSSLDGPGNEDVNLYVASFSQEKDSLSQWRAYSGPTVGFALGFQGDQLALPEGFTIARCIYKPEIQSEVIKAIVTEVFEPAVTQLSGVGPYNAATTAVAGLLLKLHTFALIFKHPKFTEEREWRIVSPVMMDLPPAYPVEQETKLAFRQGKSMLTPYRCIPLKDNNGSFPLSEVVVGPNPNPGQSLRSVRSWLSSEHIAGIEVRNSNIPYRNW